MIEKLFWLCSGVIIYNYFLYPVVIISIAKFCIRCNSLTNEVLLDSKMLPTISFIIAAYNEEKVIAEKLLNTLEIDYPLNKLEIIVVSDGSNDKTPDIVADFAQKSVISLHQKPRNGKAAALNRAVEIATGEIIVLSDANNHFNEQSCRELVKHFQSENVGGVTGLKKILTDDSRDSSEGDSLYWRYESAIKQAESDVKTITNSDGEIFAIRKSLYEPIPGDVINDDAELTFSLRRQGYIIKYESRATSSERASIFIADDYHVKVRMVAGAFQTISLHWKELFSPLDIFSAMFFSHKILRWLVPQFMLVAFLCNFFLSSNVFYFWLLILQTVFYLIASVGMFFEKKSDLPTVFYLPYYFCYMNIAALHGFIRFISKKQNVAWRKARR